VKALQTFALALVSTISVGAAAADSQSNPQLISARSLVFSFDRFVGMQVDYCLRNAPELSAELLLAHTIYAQALGWAAEIVARRYPDPVATSTVRLSDATDSRANASQLRSIQSRGPAQCVELVSYMLRASGESLAKDRIRDYENMLRRIQRSQ
jgi:hypothetical protein